MNELDMAVYEMDSPKDKVNDQLSSLELNKQPDDNCLISRRVFFSKSEFRRPYSLKHVYPQTNDTDESNQTPATSIITSINYGKRLHEMDENASETEDDSVQILDKIPSLSAQRLHVPSTKVKKVFARPPKIAKTTVTRPPNSLVSPSAIQSSIPTMNITEIRQMMDSDIPPVESTIEHRMRIDILSFILEDPTLKDSSILNQLVLFIQQQLESESKQFYCSYASTMKIVRRSLNNLISKRNSKAKAKRRKLDECWTTSIILVKLRVELRESSITNDK
ncbi:unnamed protein product [Didymodactylos carnosus]|uniref:Uncharacterized protein n=1 Tax=Didymodactylos carnosus TaxID=1234261 RepID=A0A8S2J4Q2_9BILA|nr:unnamed protein product [Didymodactylos carnosus]CAF3794578.1 unnamed protein product [Didymodactylos carnosus]